jgi:hypothetical protein
LLPPRLPARDTPEKDLFQERHGSLIEDIMAACFRHFEKLLPAGQCKARHQRAGMGSKGEQSLHIEIVVDWRFTRDAECPQRTELRDAEKRKQLSHALDKGVRFLVNVLCLSRLHRRHCRKAKFD